MLVKTDTPSRVEVESVCSTMVFLFTFITKTDPVTLSFPFRPGLDRPRHPPSGTKTLTFLPVSDVGSGPPTRGRWTLEVLGSGPSILGPEGPRREYTRRVSRTRSVTGRNVTLKLPLLRHRLTSNSGVQTTVRYPPDGNHIRGTRTHVSGGVSVSVGPGETPGPGPTNDFKLLGRRMGHDDLNGKIIGSNPLSQF